MTHGDDHVTDKDVNDVEDEEQVIGDV